MLSYILQILICQLLFLVIYDVFLKKETFFTANRIYLIVTQLLALIIPLVKIEQFQRVIPQEYIVKLPAVIIGNTNNNTAQTQTVNETIANTFNWSFELLIFIGMSIAFIIVLVKLNKISRYIKLGEKSWKQHFWLVSLPNSNAAFSFLNYVFLGDQIADNSQEAILKHELVHVKQKHSYDLLFFELLKITMWFNPLVYIYQKQLSALHEYIADAEAIKQDSKVSIYQNLLAQIFDTNSISFTNTFFKNSLIKKRIVMLNKKKSNKLSKLKYIFALPILMLALTLSSANVTKNNLNESELSESGMFEILEDNDTPLIKKIKAVRDQIQIQGNVSEVEEQGIDLLLQTVSGTSLDMNLVNKVQEYISAKNKTPLMSRISEVFEQIQMQGNITTDEEKTLKVFLLLTAEDGFENPLLQDYIGFVEIPFAVVEQAPSYPECENLDGKEERTCFSNKIASFVNKNFNIKMANTLGLEGKQRIITQFKIDKNGNVTNVRARAPHPDLAEEAKRVIKLLPKMIPGAHKGKKVIVPYSLPILFQVSDKKD